MQKGSFVQEFIAGSVGGTLGICVVYPLDTLKIRQQTYPDSGNMIQVFRDMKRYDGFKSLYRGLLSPAVGFGGTFAVSFSSYGFATRAIAKYRGTKSTELSALDMTMAGAFTGLAQSPFRQVMERVKSVMQVRERDGHKAPYSWSGACMADLVKKQGLVRGLFQGMSGLVLREVPQFAVYYPSYHIAKVTIAKALPDTPTMSSFLAGGIAGVMTWLPPILCFDAIKSFMQTAPPGTYTGVLDCTRKMYAEYGYRVFFRGFNAAMLRAFPLHGIIFIGFWGD